MSRRPTLARVLPSGLALGGPVLAGGSGMAQRSLSSSTNGGALQRWSGGGTGNCCGVSTRALLAHTSVDILRDPVRGGAFSEHVGAALLVGARTAAWSAALADVAVQDHRTRLQVWLRLCRTLLACALLSPSCRAGGAAGCRTAVARSPRGAAIPSLTLSVPATRRAGVCTCPGAAARSTRHATVTCTIVSPGLALICGG
jgi:hypothetical protein